MPRGRWIGFVNDDALRPTCVESLLELARAGLRFLPLQATDWLFEIPHDGGLLERMLRIGVRFAMLNDVVWDYYPSLLWTDRPAIR